jgi:hypothetical protein
MQHNIASCIAIFSDRTLRWSSMRWRTLLRRSAVTRGRREEMRHISTLLHPPIFRNLRSSISHAQNVDSFLVNVFDTIIGPEQPRKIRNYANGKHLGTV